MMSQMIKILGLFLVLIYISLTLLSAGASDLHTPTIKGDMATITRLLHIAKDASLRR